MRETSRFIAGEDLGAVAPWSFGAVDSASTVLAKQRQAQVAATAQATAEVARQEGFADGFAQGLAQASVDVQHQMSEFVRTQGDEAARRFAGMFDSLQDQLESAKQVIAQGVLELACEVAKQVLRQELSINPNVLLAVIREALGLLADGKGAIIRMNPHDLEVLQPVLDVEYESLSLSLVPDLAVTRGGCRVQSLGSVVDGTLEKRWIRATANLGLVTPWEDVENDA